MTVESQAPPRLVETLGPAGDCVREVLAQREQLPAPPRFTLLQERRQRRVQRQRAIALLALVGALLGVRALHRQEPLLDIRAEVAAKASNPPPPAAVSVLPDKPPSVGEPLAASESPETRATPSLKAAAPRSSRPSLARADEPSQPASGAASAPASDAVGGGGAKACAQLARGGESEQALGCYAQLASGNGMSAELALFEQARLEGKALRRPDRALRTLENYRQRFPEGSLRAEVMLAQIDWLLASGGSSRALQIVDEALASGLLRERTAELERLRATLSASSHE